MDAETAVKKYQALIGWVIKRYFRSIPAHCYDDLVQEGNCALIRATKTYDPEKGSFASYASMWIRAYVNKFLIKYRAEQYGTSGLAIRKKTHLSAQPIMSLEASEEVRTLMEIIPANCPSETNLLEQHDLQRAIQSINRVVERAFKEGNPRAKDMETLVKVRLVSSSPVSLSGMPSNYGLSRERWRKLEQVILHQARQMVEHDQQEKQKSS